MKKIVHSVRSPRSWYMKKNKSCIYEIKPTKKNIKRYNERSYWRGMGAPLFQYCRVAGVMFNEGGRYFTLSAFGTWLFFRMYLYIPIFKWNLELMFRRTA
jgi:hypothetical protein